MGSRAHPWTASSCGRGCLLLAPESLPSTDSPRWISVLAVEAARDARDTGLPHSSCASILGGSRLGLHFGSVTSVSLPTCQPDELWTRAPSSAASIALGHAGAARPADRAGALDREEASSGEHRCQKPSRPLAAGLRTAGLVARALPICVVVAWSHAAPDAPTECSRTVLLRAPPACSGTARLVLGSTRSGSNMRTLCSTRTAVAGGARSSGFCDAPTPLCALMLTGVPRHREARGVKRREGCFDRCFPVTVMIHFAGRLDFGG